MFEGARIFEYSVHVRAAFVGECAFPHIRLPVIVSHVGDLADEAGELHQFPQLGFAYAVYAQLEFQVREDGA